MDVIEMIEERIQDRHELLMKTPNDDPKRKAIAEELELLYHDYQEAQKRETERINSNIQNDISEERLKLEAEKLKNEKSDGHRRNLTSIGTTLLLVGASLFEIVLSYNEEFIKNKLPIRAIANTAKSLGRFIKR